MLTFPSESSGTVSGLESEAIDGIIGICGLCHFPGESKRVMRFNESARLSKDEEKLCIGNKERWLYSLCLGTGSPDLVNTGLD